MRMNRNKGLYSAASKFFGFNHLSREFVELLSLFNSFSFIILSPRQNEVIFRQAQLTGTIYTSFL